MFLMFFLYFGLMPKAILCLNQVEIEKNILLTIRNIGGTNNSNYSTNLCVEEESNI